MSARRLHGGLAAALLVAAAAVPDVAGGTEPPPADDCIEAAEPNDQVPDAQRLPATASCVVAEHDNPSQDVFWWTVAEEEARQRWTLTVSGIPAQAVTLQVHRVEVDDAGLVLDDEVMATASGGAGEAAAIDSLLFPAGEYIVGVGASGPGPYELTIAPGDGVPESGDAEPNDAADQATELAGEFSIAGDRATTEDWFAWDLDEDAAAQRWQLSLQTPVLGSATLRLQDGDGTSLFEATTTSDGIVELPDVKLPAARYHVVVSSSTDVAAPYVLSATSLGEPHEASEAEPNDTLAAATPIAAAVGTTTVGGRLATVGPLSDLDVYRLTVDAETAGHLVDVKLFWQGTDARELCLNDADGNELQCGSGTGVVALNDLVLTVGDYGVFVSGVVAPDDPYLLRVEVTREASAGYEAEPNDDIDHATPLDVTTSIATGSGRLGTSGAEQDSDFYKLTVTGEPQLWEITAAGPGVGSVKVRDVTGNELMAGDAIDGTATVTDVFLLPGDNWFSVLGAGDAYTIEARPLGPPDPQSEIEPNNTVDRSQPIQLSETRNGRLAQPNDADVYRFALQGDGHVNVHVDSPPDAQLMMDLRGGGAVLADIGAPSAGAPIDYDAVLQAGDYVLTVWSLTPSQERYELTIAPADPFDVMADAEPNDDVDHARPLPSTFVAAGSLPVEYTGGDADWYVIPASADTRTIRAAIVGDAATVEFSTLGTVAVPSTYLGLVSGIDAPLDIELPAGEQILMNVYGQGDYEVTVTNLGGAQDSEGLGGAQDSEGLGGAQDSEGLGGAQESQHQSANEPATDLTAMLELVGCDEPVAAFWTDAQRIDCQLEVTNTGDDDLDVTLDAAVGHQAWTVDFAETEMTVEADNTKTVDVSVDVAPDAWADQPVVVAARATESVATASTFVAVVPNAVAPPVNPTPYAPLPTALLGGLNVAASGLGAAPVAADEAAATAEASLYDERTPAGAGWSGDAFALPIELTVDLAGDDSVPVAGITLNAQGFGGTVGEQLRGFELQLSDDGQSFTTELEGELAALPVEQAFLLPEPVDARFARLRVLSGQGATATSVVIGEWSVIADPGWSLPAEVAGAGLDLSLPERGGHVVDLQPPVMDWAFIQDLVLDDDARQTVTAESGSTLSWVVGFDRNRAAQLTALTWIDPDGSDEATRFPDVEVAVSIDGSAGPWQVIGTWDLARSGAEPPRFEFPEATWARFVRITGTVAGTPDGGPVTWELPDAVHVYERATDDTYRSVLGAWGSESQAAIYEQLEPPEPITLDSDGGNDADSATELRLAEAVTDSALVGEDEDWYRVTVPEGETALAFTLTGAPTVDVEVAVFDAEGDEVAVETAAGSSVNDTTFVAAVQPGSDYVVRITEPPSSIVFAFDTSISIGQYIPFVTQGVLRYSGEVEAGQETVNIFPFGSQMLLPESSDEAYVLQSAMAHYPHDATSSDAEGALIASMEVLRSQPGAKAVVLITDAQTGPSTEQMADLWPGLGSVRPRVYAVHIGGGTPIDHSLMRDWAAVNNGVYSYVNTQGEMDVAFRRAATALRRPSIYTLSVEVTEPPPPPTTTTTSTTSTSTSTTTTSTTTTNAPAAPGTLNVVAAPPQQGVPVAAAGNASVAIIFDTSGSMLQELEGSTRADIARGALTNLVTQTIPIGTPVSLRVFGEASESCETRLLVPQGPLDPAAMAAAIQSVPIVDGVKTPIGASLDAVAADLGTGPGPKIVVLVSDGEETCEGDPAAAIQRLVDSGIDVRVNIVGFALDDEALKAQFEVWAQLGNGQYIDAGNQAELTAAVAAAVQPAYDVVTADGTIVASGQVGGDPVEVPAGSYTVVVHSTPEQQLAVEIRPAEHTDLPLG